MRISSCRLYCAGSFMRLPSFPLSAFHQAHYNILSCECGFFYLVPRADYMVRVPLYKFHTNSIAQISLCGCYCAHSTVRTPLCAFYLVHPIVCIPFYAFHRAIDGGRRRDEVKEGGEAGTFAFAVGINRVASAGSVSSESSSTGSASTRLYRSDCLCGVDC